jgi:high-affinity Fe2+/Pb2+ permease
MTQATPKSLSHEAGTSSAMTRAQVSETVRACPVSTSVVAGAIVALLAAFALVRLSQS